MSAPRNASVTAKIGRRRFLAGSAAAAAAWPSAWPSSAHAATQLSALGIDATQLGVHAASSEDQTRALQQAIERTAAARVPLVLPPGTYRTAGLRLPRGAALAGMRGATRLLLAAPGALLVAGQADDVALVGLTLDGGNLAAPQMRSLVRLADGERVRIADCTFDGAAQQALALERVGGEVRDNVFTEPGDAGVFSVDARGLAITGNTVRRAGNNAIQVWRSAAGEDGTLVSGNRIEDVRARSGGSGQYGNAIGVFRAGNVTVANNRIAGTAFSAIRGNAASALQVLGNNCSRCGEVAIYSEFAFEGAVIAGNIVDDAAFGVAIANFREGGRLTAVQGNLIRNLRPARPPGTDPGDLAGVGIGVEADTAVTGNVIENAPTAGISVGWGRYQRDVAVTGNVVRNAALGITVSVSEGAGPALIADNMIAGARGGAIVGMDYKRVATGDLARDGAGRFSHLTIGGNRVR